MNILSIKKTFLILAASAFLAGEADAALYFEQDIHLSVKGINETRAGQNSYDFKRKVYVRGEVLAIQIEEGARLKKEYGFDFGKNIYYEADPEADYYKLFDLDLLAKAFEKMGQSDPARDSSRSGIVRDLSKAVLEGRADYPVDVRGVFFGSKDFDGRRTKHYKLRAGPGSNILNPFGWYMKADIWAAMDVPGFSEYKEITAKLRKKAAFYKIKHNRISDFVIMLSGLEAFPLQVDSIARRRFGLTTSKETSREVTSFISTTPTEPEKILYFKEGGRFSWDVVYSEGTNFGREVSLKHGEDFNPRKLLPWFFIPVLFLIFTYLWFMRDSAGEDRLSLKKFLILRFYVLFSALFAAQITHTAREIPFLISPFFEFALIFLAGISWIAWQTRTHLRVVKVQMQEAHLRYCPHCRARIEAFYLVCPKCNHSIGGKHTHGQIN